MNEAYGVTVRSWLVEPLRDDVVHSVQRIASSDDVQHVAMMPDVHLSSDVCVGLAVATRQLLYPAAVGADIGCGMLAIATDTDASLLKSDRVAATLLAELGCKIPTLKHAHRSMLGELPDELRAKPLSDSGLDKLAARDGLWQLGTLGRGNHFVEFQADESDQLWLMMHSGSRGMGQAITRHHLQRAERPAKLALARLDVATDVGQAYLHDVEWATHYAAANRLAMLRAIESILADRFGVNFLPETLIHSNHNHVRYEWHHGKRLLIHRKGALSAADGEPGVIPGSMGTASYHVTGRGHPDSLMSSSHGAGRRMSRSDASRRIRAQQFERELSGVWYDHRLTHRLRDEAPSAYKEIGEVMRAQRQLTRIRRRLHPLLNYK